jgi:hypothetical protein
MILLPPTFEITAVVGSVPTAHVTIEDTTRTVIVPIRGRFQNNNLAPDFSDDRIIGKVTMSETVIIPCHVPPLQRSLLSVAQ